MQATQSGPSTRDEIHVLTANDHRTDPASSSQKQKLDDPDPEKDDGPASTASNELGTTSGLSWRALDSEDRRAVTRLVWKQDVRIMPLAVWVYLLAYLDRSNIGNAKVLHHDSGRDLLTVLDMTEYDFTIALMLFFVAYILFETPSNWALKRFRPSRWIALICLVWGILTMCLGAVQNFAQLAAVRFLLGAVEAGLFPGLVTVLTFWYRPEERSIRVALVLASATLAGAFGGALATAISYLDGVRGLEAWRWIFILEGLPSVLTAPVVYFCFPDWPETVLWLSSPERALAEQRLSGDAGFHASHPMTWTETKAVLTDWRLYFHYLAYMGISAPFSSLSLFAPTIVAGMGYSNGVQANLFTVPPYAVAWVVTIAVAYLGDHYNRRGIASASAAAIAALCFAIEGGLQGGHYPARYAVLIIATSGAFACIPPLLGWLSSNVRGTTAATLVIPINVSFGGFGQIVGVWIYKASGKPRYPTGQFTNFAFLLLTSITALGLELFYVTRNRKMVKLVGEPKDLYKY